MGSFEEGIYTILVCLPYVFMLTSIVFLLKGFYLKKHIKIGKKNFIISFVCFIMGILIYLLPVILLVIIKMY